MGKEQEVLQGTVLHVTYYNKESCYAICDLELDKEVVTITGNIPSVASGQHLTVTGNWVRHPKYGLQFQVLLAEIEQPTDKKNILRYLSDGFAKGLGAKTAKKIVDRFGDETFQVLEEHIEWLEDLGISKKIVKNIQTAIAEKTEMRNTTLFFQNYYSSTTIKKIYRKWGKNAVSVVRENPYALCREIEGIGFEKADALAKDIGFDTTSSERIESGIIYLLENEERTNGHICYPKNELISLASNQLSVSGDHVNACLREMIAKNHIKCREDKKEIYCYTPFNYFNEKYIAEKLLLLNRVSVPVNANDIDGFLKMEEAELKIRYSDLQRTAIHQALSSGVMILTGGPGTGKTTIVRSLIHIFSNMDFKIALSAPTGRASKRLSESTGEEAKTIHRLLEYNQAQNETGTFQRNEENRLDENVIIVDEMSMVDSALMSALLKAVKPGARLILIGDADQLPSVGGGNVLHDLIASKRFSTVCLNEIFRQAKESKIIINAHAVNEGRMPDLDDKKGDFFFLERNHEEDIATTIVDLYKNRLPKTYGDLATFGMQILSPGKKGETGVEHLNEILQQAVNPEEFGKEQMEYRGTTFRVGDKVMQVKNNYELEWENEITNGVGIFNGDIGTILDVNREDETLSIRFDDRTVDYPFENLEDLTLAYAITIHKSQGSEYPIVLLPVGNVPYLLCYRNLLYTAITRAQQMVIMVGKRDTVSAMVKREQINNRYTGLKELLCQN